MWNIIHTLLNLTPWTSTTSLPNSNQFHYTVYYLNLHLLSGRNLSCWSALECKRSFERAWVTMSAVTTVTELLVELYMYQCANIQCGVWLWTFLHNCCTESQFSWETETTGHYKAVLKSQSIVTYYLIQLNQHCNQKKVLYKFKKSLF